MPNSKTDEPSNPTSPNESFGDLLAQFDRDYANKPQEGARQGTVVSVSVDSVFLDIGFKTEGVLPLAELGGERDSVKPGDRLQVTIKGRDPEGYYLLTRGRVVRATDWSALEKAFAKKTPIVGTVVGVVKGGLNVDVGVRAFMPASRSGARDAGEMEKLVEQEIRCRIIKLDAADEDVVVDRRAVLEEEEQSAKQRRYSDLREGDVVTGTVRSLTDYGAFVDIGGVDGLLHVGDVSWSRINHPSDVLSEGQQIEVRILKVDTDKRRISLGLKQLQPHPWDAVPTTYKVGERVRGRVTRVTDFGAFVELAPGVEGLIHVSEMSWVKRVKRPADLLKAGDTVEAVILGINQDERRMSLGLKQALGDPWANAAQKFPVGSAVEGPVVSLTKFGAFLELSDGLEGMVHVSDISAEKRINHPQDVLRVGQIVKAQVLEVDSQKRRLKLGMKQLVPTSIDEYLSEHKPGDIVSGRIVSVNGNTLQVELGEGIQATGVIPTQTTQPEPNSSVGKADLASLTSMLQTRWKTGDAPQSARPPDVQAGQVRTFRITRIDPTAKKMEVELQRG